MKTDIVMILDRSGSMESIAQDTIGGVNTFLAGQKAAPGEATFTLVQFDDRYELVHDAVPIARVEPLTAQTFVPRGSTALLDTLARAIDATGFRIAALPEAARPAKVVCVIVTDGAENASHTATRAQVFDKITHQRDVYQWEFVFLGANQDAIGEASKLGIGAAAAMNYAPSQKGVQATYAAMSARLTSVRSGGAQAMAFSDEDRKQASQK
jgi:hypothetical protein